MSRTPRIRGVFVTGTDTGVGKTFVSCALARGLRARGVDIGVMKPAETGVGAAGPLDAHTLREAACVDDALELVCPQAFAMPAAPTVAAAAEGRKVDLDAILDAAATLAARHEFLLIEGAGGLRVPLCDGLDMADFAARLGLPILLVARAALGTINHTLLSLEAAEQRGLECLGVVVSHGEGVISAADAANLDGLRVRLGSQLVGEIPSLRPDEIPDPEQAGIATVLEWIQRSSAGD